MVKCASGSGVGVVDEIRVGFPVHVADQEIVGDSVSDGDTVSDKVGTFVVKSLLLVAEPLVGIVDWNDCPAPHAEIRKKIPAIKPRDIFKRHPIFAQI